MMLLADIGFRFTWAAHSFDVLSALIGAAIFFVLLMLYVKFFVEDPCTDANALAQKRLKQRNAAEARYDAERHNHQETRKELIASREGRMSLGKELMEAKRRIETLEKRIGVGIAILQGDRELLKKHEPLLQECKDLDTTVIVQYPPGMSNDKLIEELRKIIGFIKFKENVSCQRNNPSTSSDPKTKRST